MSDQPIAIHGLVVLLRGRTQPDVPQGSRGTVVHDYGNGTYEVEFSRHNGPFVLTCARDELRDLKARVTNLDRLKASLKEAADEETKQTLAEPDRPSGYAVDCASHGRIPLGLHEYARQLAQPNRFWTCPRCGESAPIVEPETCPACKGEGHTGSEMDPEAPVCAVCRGAGFLV